MRGYSFVRLLPGCLLTAAILAPGLPAQAQAGQPAAHAGKDRAVSPGTTVVLDGRGSRGEGLSYAWRQLSGPAATLHDATAPTPSFRAPESVGAYVFLLAVRDAAGQSATDLVTVAVRLPLERQLAARAAIGGGAAADALPPAADRYALPVNMGLAVLSVAVVLLSTLERVRRLLAQLGSRWRRRTQRLRPGAGPRQIIRVVDTRSGQGLEGVQLVVREAEGEQEQAVRTGRHGAVHLQLPPGAYLLGLAEPAYALAPAISADLLQEGELMYAGGYLEVGRDAPELRVAVPAGPAGGEKLPLVAAWRLRGWQFLQRQGHRWAWGAVAAGAVLNTVLLLAWPQVSFLLIEAMYIALVGMKLVLEMREKPSYGIVRDAITHLPIDLAVVRFYNQRSGRLVMTRVTDGQGKFFALPPYGAYTLMVARDGYLPFQREGVEVHGQEDKPVHLIAELMPNVQHAAAPLAGIEPA